MVDLNASKLSSVFDDENERDEIEVEAKAKGSKKRASDLVHGLEINFQDSDLDQEREEEEGELRKKKAKVGNNNKKSDPKSKKDGKIDGATVEQHRRYMGDQVKSKLRVLGGKGNYGIAASCHVSMSCSVALFRTLIVPNAVKVTPANFDGSSPVVLAQIDSTEQIGKQRLYPPSDYPLPRYREFFSFR